MVKEVIQIHLKLPRDLKKAYTKNVYQFYHEFFPGVQVHRRGKIYVSDLDKALKGAALTHYGPGRKYYEKLLTEMQRAQETADQELRSEGQKCPMIDFYAARDFIVRMKRIIACVDNGYNVLKTFNYDPDDWATFYHTAQRFYQNYHEMITTNDGSVDMDEVRKTYSDAKRRFPNSKAFEETADEHVEIVKARYDLDNSGELTFGEAREWILSFAWFFDGDKVKEEEEAADTDAEDTPCGEELRSPTPSYSSESIPSSVDEEESIVVEAELESPINEGIVADITMARDTVIKMKLVNQKIHRSLKLASTHVRERRSGMLRSLYQKSASKAKTRSGKTITHVGAERVYFTTLGMNIVTALDKGYDETLFNATKSIECYVEDCLHALKQIMNVLDQENFAEIVDGQTMEATSKMVANYFKPPKFKKYETDFRKWGGKAKSNILDSLSGMTLEEKVDHDKDKIYKGITADYMVLKNSKMNPLPRAAKEISKTQWNSYFGEVAGSALTSFREEMMDTINHRITMLNKFIASKVEFLGNASRAINEVEDGLWTYSIKELTARVAIENLADDNMDLVHALMKEDSKSLYKREKEGSSAAFSSIARDVRPRE
ncbi:Oidioi.mRNA.OKI2018_I69.chr1.g1944.t1.cds [Oikopleura dioica]|uniref:Oidioi.mRNA.OKI2018_I69.chr1.g1944.t1.cds n=1 Tax=Oikopleura dioica TaxID=34765 RepID=A0ABN7STD6_OIKDI|nr:Oidioi.mRNA.OKI2018_I69.chr1.g1944.t1.cds [Oikopleura dioica]